ncbi:MAG: ADP-ribosylglycohydrolase family protein, partial [Endozoicomonas sp.]
LDRYSRSGSYESVEERVMNMTGVQRSFQTAVVACILMTQAGCHTGSLKEPAEPGDVKMKTAELSVRKSYPEKISREDRIKGALLGYLAGDALGLGTHWYYDLDQLHHDYGSWVDSYQDPHPSGSHNFAFISRFRYEQGLRAGDVSQAGQIVTLLLESVTSTGRYQGKDFHQRLDQFFQTLNGESLSGRFTESIIKSLWDSRRQGISWDDPAIATGSDTSDGAQLGVILALTYDDPEQLAEVMDTMMAPFFRDDFIRANQLVYALVLQALVKGVQLEDLPGHLRGLASNPAIRQRVGSFDNFLTPGNGAVAWKPEVVRIEPALYVSHVYGMDCQVMHLLPTAYYLMHRYPDDFEMGLLSAINGGGNNMARGALTGALLGAMNGIGAIPERFVKDLRDSSRYLELADKLARSH